MALLERIDTDLAEALKAGVVTRVSLLRLLKSAIKNEQIKLGHSLSEEEVQKVLQREAKQRKDSITQYQAGGRQDLAQSEQQELGMIQEYLPQQMDEAELAQLVDAVIAETGAADMAQMGVVIGAVLQRAGGRADGAAVSALVRQKLGA